MDSELPGQIPLNRIGRVAAENARRQTLLDQVTDRIRIKLFTVVVR
jgi:hypothetical protein